MKVITLTSAQILLSAGYGMAGPGSGQPRTPGDPESGRPAQVLDNAKYGARPIGRVTPFQWAKAAPFVVNFALVDADNDGKLTAAEFTEGCKKGLVQESASAQQPAGKIIPKEPAMEQ